LFASIATATATRLQFLDTLLDYIAMRLNLFGREGKS